MPGLYVHIPFCAKRCHYCDFVIAPGAPSHEHAAFLSALEEEARREQPRAERALFDTVYLGGGTPSRLSEEEFRRLFFILRSAFRWRPDAEVTCEVNPGDIDPGKARALKELGVNRVSLGAQTFHDQTLLKLNRAHDAAAIRGSFASLREAGFGNISVDLILSLPDEDWPMVQASLEALAALKPEHVSLYELTIEDKTLFGELHKKGKLPLPSEEEQLETLTKARLFLQRRGWKHYELLSYAKPGRESRHNRLYWDNADTLGLGPGAWSHWKGRRWRRATSYRDYMAKIEAKDWSLSDDETLSPEKKEIESFVLGLRLTEGVPLERFAAVIARFEEEIAALSEKGMLTRHQGRLCLTPRGQYFAESVFSELSA